MGAHVLLQGSPGALAGRVFGRERPDIFCRQELRQKVAAVLDRHPTLAGQLEGTPAALAPGDLRRRVRGGVSGGTLASLKGAIDDVKKDRSLVKVLADPYALSPDRDAEPELGNEADMRGAENCEELGTWFGPFVMAPVNTRVVRRSNALQGWAYGRRFRYREVMAFGSGLIGRAKALAVGGMAALAAGLALPPSRLVLDRVLPGPGAGPNEDVVRQGFFVIEINARTAAGERWVCRVEAQGDPGYGATSVMLGESALALGLDSGMLPDRAGVLTPATGIGLPLADRLTAAGQTLRPRAGMA
jgi:short subunit dehydrogenase-like uncharacterized protein